MEQESVSAGVPRGLLEASRAVICALDRDLRITYCNPAWDRFAQENRGQNAMAGGVLGSLLLEVVAEPLRAFYCETFERARATLAIQEFDYECSSAETFRQFHMQILPLREEGGGFLAIHSLRVERPHARVAQPSADERYAGPGGLVVMCCHCRRTRHAHDPEAWDWVPDYLKAPPGGVSHGLCPICFAYFYPGVYASKGSAGLPR